MKQIKNEAIKEAINLKKQGKKIEVIAKKLGVSSSTVLGYTKGIPHPNNIHALIHLSNYSKKLSKEKAEILGYLSAEGSDYDRMDSHLGFDKRRNKSYKRKIKRSVIEFSNTDLGLQRRFKELIFKVYNYNPYFIKKKGNFYIKRLEIVRDIRKYSRFGSKKWQVPREILDSKDFEKKILFCRAFGDGDGTIDKKKRKVILDSTNSKGLLQVFKLLQDLGFINLKFYSFKQRRYRIVINDTYRYYKIINFIHPRKKLLLKKICMGLK